MIIVTKVQKWGNGLAIRIAGMMRDIPHFEEGTPIQVEVTEQGLTITKQETVQPLKFPYSEHDLIADLTPHTAHADILAKPLDTEF